MEEIPFNVSARTARLIGRENIASSKGAIIELVKNAYDADSSFCIVYFDTYYSQFKSELTEEEYNFINDSSIIDSKLLNQIYTKIENIYYQETSSDENKIKELSSQLQLLANLYIIDAGDGMTKEIIKNHWMTIGTDNKLTDIFTKNGRVKSGAKGIGRFALDKLGNKCEMITKFNPNVYSDEEYPSVKNKSIDSYKWEVNWCDFEGEFKHLNNVTASLEGLKIDRLKKLSNKRNKTF